MKQIVMFWLFGCIIYYASGCGASAADYLAPVWEATVEGCYQRQRNAVTEAEDRESAELRVARIRAKCDEAYTGLRAAGWVLETALPGGEE